MCRGCDFLINNVERVTFFKPTDDSKSYSIEVNTIAGYPMWVDGSTLNEAIEKMIVSVKEANKNDL